MKYMLSITGFFLSLFVTSQLSATLVDDLLQEYQKAGASGFDAARGEALWKKSFPDPKGAGKERSCTTCHTDNLRNAGKHATTGKAIEPLAPSVNNKRLTDRKEIEKWFLRNCKWTLGRECSAQEKGDILLYLRSQ
ncbi:MAG: DUF1924 domain-containing protein [Gammaproteobacteria bacterium]|nr:DUF1924 domain-containing protein [Gammaproteobacteria bacterium]